jgi:ribosomal protein L37AE/L43A
MYDDPERALARAMARRCPSCGSRARQSTAPGWWRCRKAGKPYNVEFQIEQGEIKWRWHLRFRHSVTK